MGPPSAGRPRKESAAPLLQAREKQSSADNRCQSFTPKHAPRTRFSLCSHCFRRRTTRLLPLPSTAADGFYGIERGGFSWTNGDARMNFTVSKSEAGRTCDLRVDAPNNRPFHFVLDGRLLGEGPWQPLPALVADTTHELRIQPAAPVTAQEGTGN